MAAYVIVDVEVVNAEPYQEYIKLAPPTIKQYGGEYLVRGGNMEIIEGDWNLNRFVILRFDTMEQARTWYNSPEYQAIIQIRLQNTNSKMIWVEGVLAPVS